MNKKQHTLNKVVALLLFAMMTPCLMWAQKKELAQARSYIKSGKDFDKAERLMTDLLKKDSASRDNKKVYQTWLEAVQKQYDVANEKLYLKQKQDTAVFFDLARRMFAIAETLDSIDMRPDKKGRVDPEFRQKHASLLSVYRTNLYNAGSYFIRKDDFKKAYEYYETYIDCKRQPLFTDYKYETTDNRLPEAGYWVTYCGYKLQDPVLTLRYRKLALRDSSKAQFTLMYLAEARRWMKDQELYLKTLEEGFRRYPTFHYFFPRLMDEYERLGLQDKALETVDSALAVNDSSQLFLFAKSTVLLRMERWAECINYSEQLIQLCDSLPEPYFNAGTAYLNLAEKLDEKKEKKLRRTAFQNAQKYLERYRLLAPKEKNKWAPALYRIYLNLNLGRQFDEIDRLLKG